jgi:hypothetical protein
MNKYERNMQELCDTIQRPNLLVMSIEGNEVQAKGIRSILSKMIQKTSQIEKEMTI